MAGGEAGAGDWGHYGCGAGGAGVCGLWADDRFSCGGAQHVFKMKARADITRIGAAFDLHKVMDEIVMPARTGARHANGKNNHVAASTGFLECILIADTPTRIPRLIHKFGMAKESCVIL